MPITKVIAKRDFDGIFKKGDRLTIEPKYYEKDTVICNEVYGVFKDDLLIRFWGYGYSHDNKTEEVRLVYDKVIAKKGEVSGHVIVLEDGTRYPSSLVRDFSDWFEKVEI